MTEFQPYSQPPEHLLGRPQDLDAEQKLLGAILWEPERYYEACQIISGRDFLRSWNAWVWYAVADLMGQDVQLTGDVIERTMLRQMPEETSQHEISIYLYDLKQSVAAPSHAAYYARLVANDAVRRRICENAPLMTVAANDYGLSIEELRERVEALKASAVDITENESQSAHASELAPDVLGAILEDAAAGRRKCGAETGLWMLDSTLAGLTDGTVTLIAARSGIGKSALALRIAETFCRRRDRVVYFSLEMSKESLMERLASSFTRIPLSYIRNRALDARQIQDLRAGAAEIGSWDLQLDDKAGVTAQYMRARLRQYSRQRAVSLVIVDHMHIMEASVKTGDTVKDLAAVTVDLHNLARDLRIPVLSLCQLNRGPENRPDSAPLIRDIRGSGGIEENADSIIGIHRPQFKDARDGTGDLPECEEAELHILKNRQGPVGGFVKIVYKADCVRFDNSAGEARGYHIATPAPPEPAAPTTEPFLSMDEDPFGPEPGESDYSGPVDPLKGWMKE